jgi:hypothetical protein
MVKSCLSKIVLGVAAFALFGFPPAEASCQLIHATHSARSQAKAVQTSQALALRSAYDLQRAMGWSHITLTAYPVMGHKQTLEQASEMSALPTKADMRRAR